MATFGPPPPPPAPKKSSPPPPTPKPTGPVAYIPTPITSTTKLYYTGGGSGGSSGRTSPPPPVKPTVYSSNLLQQNFSSQADLQAAESKFRQEQAAQQLKSFSKTGGLNLPSSSGQQFFKTSVNDVQTQSQAIKTATKIADDVANKNIKQSSITIPQNLGLTRRNVNVIETSKGKFYDFGQGYADEQAFEQYKQTGAWKNTTQFLTKDEVVKGRVSQVKQLERQQQIQATLAEEEQFKALGQFFAGGGSQITGLGSNIISRVVGRVTLGVATSPLVGTTTKALASVGDDVIRLLSPTNAGASQAGNLVVGGTTKVVSEGTKKVVKDVGTFAVSQAASATGYLLSSQAPQAARDLYDTQNPEQAQKFKDLRNTPEYKKAVGESFVSAQVNTYGGKQQDQEGNISDVESTTNPIEGFVASSLPFTRSTNPEFVANFDFKDRASKIPGYDKLSAQEKKEFVESTKERELTYANTYGGAASQLGTEISSEIGGAGANKLFFNKLSGGLSGSAGRQAAARAITVLPYGTAEGYFQVLNEASAEQRVAEASDLLLGSVAGAGTSAFFAAAPTYLRGIAGEGTETVVKKGAKKGVKKQVESGLKKGVAQVIETGGYVLDLAEKPGDILASPFKKGLGINTLTLTPSGTATTTSTSTKNSSKGKTKSVSKGQAATYDIATKTYTDSKGRKSSMSLGSVPSETFVFSSSNVNVPSGVDNKGISNLPINQPTEPIIPPETPEKGGGKTETDVDDKTETDEETKQEEKTETNVPTFTNVETTSSVPVIVPQRFMFPGFFPIGSSGRSGARQKTRIYDELAAAGKRFEQLSGLNFGARKK